MDVVYLSGYDFRGFVWFRPQQLMTRLARGHRVLYVEPTRARKWRRPWRWGLVRRERDRLLVLEPPVLPGLRWSRAVRALNEALLRRRIKSLVRRLGFRDVVTVVGTPFAARIAGSLGERLVVYDCNDDWASIPKLPARYLRREEERLARGADVVFAASRRLFERLAAFNERTVLLPSGVDVEQFAGASEPADVPDELRGLRSPVIGSIGSINATKDDLDLLEAVAAQRPGWSFVFVGPVMADVDLSRYPALRRVGRFLGARPHAELPAYVRVMDVCVLAYKRNAFTASANPTKVFEYLSAGKPVVATPLEDLAGLEPFVTLARGTDEFIGAIEAALDGRADAAMRRARIERSRERSWDAIVGAFEAQIEQRLMEVGHVPNRPVHRLVQQAPVH
jgi:glycosyltransferase involved in cell wall biosynthesis